MATAMINLEVMVSADPRQLGAAAAVLSDEYKNLLLVVVAEIVLVLF